MFGLNLIPVEVLGVLAAFVAGLFSLIPALGLTNTRKAVVAIIVLIFAVLMKDNFIFTTWQAFLITFSSAAVYAVVSYKLILQPLVLPTTQKALVGMGLLQPGA